MEDQPLEIENMYEKKEDLLLNKHKTKTIGTTKVNDIEENIHTQRKRE